MTDQKPVLLLPGPDSAAAAPHYFGAAYEYVSYLTENYFESASAYITNGKLKPLAGRDVLLWQPPHRGRGEALKAGPESILRHLLKLECKVHIIAFSETDDQYEPHVCHRLEMPKDEVLAWARAHKRSVEPPPPDVPRETKVTRGRPRSRADGSPTNGAQTDGNTGSVFVSWERLGLECNSNGSPHPHLANAFKILSNHPELVGRIWFDEFHDKIFQTLFQPEPVEWHDTHDTRLTVWIQTNLRIAKMGHQVVQRAVDDYARQHIRNEVREWMEALQWDQHERLPTMIAEGWGAPKNDYTAAVGRCWIVSMVARTYEPGCKVDTMPVFEGPQGIHKSSALATIGGKWFSEMHEDITTKDFLQNLPGKLLLEISELHAFRRAEINRIKGIISCASDRYRASYGRRAEDHPRRGVFSGTVNGNEWVEDDTGARRFWPIACTEINLDYLRTTREQLFAEAVYRYKAGESWWDIDPELARQEQDARRSEDPWAERVLDYARTFGEVRIPDVMTNALMLPPHQQDKGAQMRVAAILKTHGFGKKDVRKLGRIVKYWLKC